MREGSAFKGKSDVSVRLTGGLEEIPNQVAATTHHHLAEHKLHRSSYMKRTRLSNSFGDESTKASNHQHVYLSPSWLGQPRE